jgi:sulfur relay protein TusB/DsrH
MSKLIIISKTSPEDLPLIQELFKRNKDNVLVLLSDAVFLLNDNKLIENFQELFSSSRIFALNEDIQKRDPINKNLVISISYEELVNLLLKEDTSIVNL